MSWITNFGLKSDGFFRTEENLGELDCGRLDKSFLFRESDLVGISGMIRSYSIISSGSVNASTGFGIKRLVSSNKMDDSVRVMVSSQDDSQIFS